MMFNKILAVYKPKGPTSNDIVQKIKRSLGVKKVGHAGTLDPLAKGVLVVGIGQKATKKLGQMVKLEKEYLAKIKLGQQTKTFDSQGEKIKNKVAKIPLKKEVKEVLQKFIGQISQTPPVYSAVKISGVEAYKLARKGKKVSMSPRIVAIKDIKLISYVWPFITIKVVTGPGVYIRSLASDIGKKLKTGAFLKELERTRVGEYTWEKAKTVSQVKSLY